MKSGKLDLISNKYFWFIILVSEVDDVDDDDGFL